MTKRFAVLAALLLLIATAAHAQNTSISVFATQIGGGWTRNEGSTYTADYGLGVEQWFTPRVSAAVNISKHSDFAASTIFDLNGFPTTTFYRVNEYPIDALLRYRFAGSDRWKPYLGGGLRAVRGFARYGNRVWSVQPEVNGGVTFKVTPHLGLDFDGKFAPNESRYVGGVDQFRASIGLSWHF